MLIRRRNRRLVGISGIRRGGHTRSCQPQGLGGISGTRTQGNIMVACTHPMCDNDKSTRIEHVALGHTK